MKIVLDTNVVVSGLLHREGTCGHILRLALGGIVPLCVDDRILREYERVLARPLFRLHPEDVSETLKLIRVRDELITPAPLGVGLPDRTDLPFLETAAAANAVLVSGNIRHFPAHSRAGVTVVTPKQFLDLVERALPSLDAPLRPS